MTNQYPYAHGSFYHGGSGAPNLPTGLPGSSFPPPRTSYASVASGAASFANLLNPPPDDSPGGLDADTHRNGTENGTGGGSGLRGHRNPLLPSFSRAFEHFMPRAGVDGYAPPKTNAGFFTPSYLRESTYVQKLEELHKAKASGGRDGQAASSPGGGLVSNGSSLSLHGSKLVAPSQRSVTFERVDKPPPFEDDDGLAPLPSRWNKIDKSAGLDVLADGLEVKYAGSRSSSEREHEACSIRADHYMPPPCGIYYFEVIILARKRDDTTIGIGFCDRSVALARPPGWEPASWGYHGDDGHVYASQNVGKQYGPAFTAPDVIGCGVNFRTGCAFYTKNGVYLGTAFRDVKGPNLKLFPIIGLKKSGEHIKANFGQEPFVFDIDGMMKAEQLEIKKQIEATSTASLAPPLEETDLIQQLILQFLQHDGYVETARAFAEEVQGQKQALNLDPDVEIEGVSITDDEDASNRQRIRKAVLEGDIDRAIKHTNAYYPKVLQDNEQVKFRLRCRKFIEMVRREAEINMMGGNGRSNGHHQDVDMIDMDMEDGTDGPAESGVLALESLAYGQGLAKEYSDDPRNEVRTALRDVFALMAYENPLKVKEVAHLLDRKGRTAVAEELNSAILQSLGKSSRSALENLYAQTSVLLEDLRQDGGPGSFVTIQGVINEIH